MIDVRNFGFFVDVPGLAMSGLVHLFRVWKMSFFTFSKRSATNWLDAATVRVIRLGDTRWRKSRRWTVSKRAAGFSTGEGSPALRPAGQRHYAGSGADAAQESRRWAETKVWRARNLAGAVGSGPGAIKLLVAARIGCRHGIAKTVVKLRLARFARGVRLPQDFTRKDFLLCHKLAVSP